MKMNSTDFARLVSGFLTDYLPCWYDASSVVSYAGKKGDMRFEKKNLLLVTGKKRSREQ